MPPPLTTPSIPASPAENRKKEKEKVMTKSKAKGKETAGNRKRKRSDDEAYRDIHNLTADSLVQQVMRNITSTEALLTCQLSAGVGTGRPS
jgi:hypothetical protein